MTTKRCEQYYATAKWRVTTLRLEYDCCSIVIPASNEDGQLLYDVISILSRVDDCSAMPFPISSRVDDCSAMPF